MFDLSFTHCSDHLEVISSKAAEAASRKSSLQCSPAWYWILWHINRLGTCVQVSAVLDRKEALLMQLRNMNDEAEAGLHLDNTGRHTEAFQVQYAQIVLELKQVSTPFLS